MLFCFNPAEVFQIAIEIEENGKSFYERAQEIVEDAEVQKLFSELAREEVEHRKRFDSIKSALPGDLQTPTVSDPDNQLDQYIKMMADQHVFSSTEEMILKVSEIRSVSDALKLAIQFEKDSVIFYLGMQEATCEGKARDLVSLLIKEEQDHVRRLSLQLRRVLR